MSKTNTAKTIYVLSETIEHEISTPVTYLDFTLALSELISRMAQAFGYSEEEINYMLSDLTNGVLGSECFLHYDKEKGIATAYGVNLSNANCDWDISPVKISL